jgi:hypothetical protein
MEGKMNMGILFGIDWDTSFRFQRMESAPVDRWRIFHRLPVPGAMSTHHIEYVMHVFRLRTMLVDKTKKNSIYGSRNKYWKLTYSTVRGVRLSVSPSAPPSVRSLPKTNIIQCVPDTLLKLLMPQTVNRQNTTRHQSTF